MRNRNQHQPIEAPLPDIVQYPRQVRFRGVRSPIRSVEVQQEAQEEAAAAATPNEQASRSESEEEDEIQLCHVSSSEDSTADTSDTDEDRRHFERELEANPALRRAYDRSEAARRQRGHFNARPGHLLTRRHTRGRETRNPIV